MKSERQQQAEDRARQIARARRDGGVCTKDVYDGFNSKRGCTLEFGHKGHCE